MDNGATYLPGGGEGKVPQWWGCYYAYIAVNNDPLDQGRVKLRVPQVFGNTTSGWASPMVPLSYVPKVGTAVVCMFVGGDPAQPVWFGNFAIPEGAAGFVISETAPSDPELGEIWVNSSTGLMSEWNGASWIGYQIGGAAIQTGSDIQAPNITGGTITGATINVTGADGSGVSINPASSSSGGGPDAYIFFDGAATSRLTTIQPQIYAAVDNADTNSETDWLIMYSGQSTATSTSSTANAALQLVSASADNTTYKAHAQFDMNGNVVNLNGNYAGSIPVTQTTYTGYTCNTTGFTKFSYPYVIPANDANYGTVYRIKGFGNGWQDNNAIEFEVYGWGTSLCTLGIGAVAFPSGGINITLMYEAMILVYNIGTSGAVYASMTASISEASGNVGAAPSGAQMSTTGTQNTSNSSTAVDTTAASNLFVRASVSSTGDSIAVYSICSTFERLGP